MSVLADILAALPGLLEGTTVVDRAIPPGRFAVVGDDHDWDQAQSSTTPRPVFIEVGEELTDAEAPQDWSGDYYYRSRRIYLYTAYAFSPDDDPTDRTEAMADDDLMIVRCLGDPLTWADAAVGWVGTEISSRHEVARDPDGVAAIAFTVTDLAVMYREDLS